MPTRTQANTYLIPTRTYYQLVPKPSRTQYQRVPPTSLCKAPTLQNVAPCKRKKVKVDFINTRKKIYAANAMANLLTQIIFFINSAPTNNSSYIGRIISFYFVLVYL